MANGYYNVGVNSYYNRYNNDYYNYPPMTMIEPKEKPESNVGKILAGAAVVTSAIAAVQLVRKGKLSGAKKAVTDLYSKGLERAKKCINTEKITKYTEATKKFFTEGKGQKVWNPVKNVYKRAKNIFVKNDAFANIPKFNAFEYEAGKFNPHV